MRCQEIDRLQFLDSISGIVIIRIFECTETNLRFLLEEIIILVGTLYMVRGSTVKNDLIDIFHRSCHESDTINCSQSV